MKTFIKTITVVSIATLTTVGTFNLNITSKSTGELASQNADIYFPTEKIMLADEVKPVSKLTENNSVNLSELVKFKPTESINTLVLPEETTTIEQLIRFVPSTIEFDEESWICEIIAFQPTDLTVESIEEPATIDEMIKFAPTVTDNESIIEPVESVESLIKFAPSMAISTEIETPQSIDEMIKFTPSFNDQLTIEEPEAAK